jgi:4-diphosphocytidyl-2-C-methyl-D-erythritol kinase
MTAAAWPAPAKLNLFLHITGRRADGYHELQTVFQFLDYGDTLYFTPRDDGRIRHTNALVDIAEQDDLTVRAAQLLQRHAGIKQGIDIRIDKILPQGGGLGGGSSDAATTLVALNVLWQAGLSPRDLAQLGLQLGADVPVFVHGHAAWAEGVGEVLSDVDLPEPWYVVIHPGVHVSTALLFAAPELTRDARPIKIRDYLAGGGANVFEVPVKTRYPAVAQALDWLTQESGRQARMTGSGSCIFVALDSEDQARQLMQTVPPQWKSFYARGLNRSPLLNCKTEFGT